MDCFFFCTFHQSSYRGKGMWADLAICREFIRRFTPIPMVRGEKWRNGGCFGWLISIIAGKHLFSTINTTTPYIGYHYLFWFHQCLTVRHFLKYPWRMLSEFLGVNFFTIDYKSENYDEKIIIIIWIIFYYRILDQFFVII